MGSDNFKDNAACAADDKEYARKHASFGFKSRWQFNHEPDLALVKKDEAQGIVTVTTDKLCKNVVQAKNVLTQRTTHPGCAAEVLVDGSALKEGDYAGICLMESAYAFVALTRRNGELWIVMKNRKAPEGMWGERHDQEPGDEWASVKVTPSMLVSYGEGACGETSASADGEAKGEWVRLRFETDFAYMKDEAQGYYADDEKKMAIGPVSKLRFKLDHFTGVRFGLFVFSTEKTGGSASFADFVYQTKVDGAWEKC